MGIIIDNVRGYTLDSDDNYLNKPLVHSRVTALSISVGNGTANINWTAESTGTWNTSFWPGSGATLTIPSGLDGSYLVHARIDIPYTVTAQSYSGAGIQGAFVINGVAQKTFQDRPGGTIWDPKLDSAMIVPLVSGNTVALQFYMEGSPVFRTANFYLTLCRLSA